jgi:alkanesulfonate monooxygenase SsuD/methylene tetrahydromethanopterin reductase-like flavin-dependent oxidoreductase (luciferase family)
MPSAVVKRDLVTARDDKAVSDHRLRLAVALNGYGLDHPAEDGGHREILPWHDLRVLGVLAEELGYEAIFAPEIGGWEAFTALTGLAAGTSDIRLVTGVVPISARTPERLAMAAASLQELSGGRFTLGVGSRDSIAKTRGFIEQLRGMASGGSGSDWAGFPRPVQIHLAALGPKMTALAGEVADGVILNWATPRRVEQARDALPQRDGFTIAVYVRACLSPADEQATDALRIAARRYAALVPYRRQFEAMGVNASDLDDVVSKTCVIGDRGQALQGLAEYARAGADVVVVYPVPAGDAVSSIKGTMIAAAPGR